jgi:CheY-like chemotaxis protein
MTHVLVVDDDGLICEVMRDILEYVGYHVTLAHDGWAALAHLRASDTPLVVLVDQRLPELTGTQVVATYLADTPTSRREFILLTADPEQVVPSLNGRLPMVRKPFGVDTLLETVAQAAARLDGAG